MRQTRSSRRRTPSGRRTLTLILPICRNSSYQSSSTNLSASEYELTPAGYSPQNNATYYQGDQLGSARVLIAGSGWPIVTDTFYPFGQEEVTPAGDNTMKFTGKERDTESGLDYFGARYYASSMGRFMIPDWADKPEAVPYSSLDNPQSLNLYNYMRNNPLGGVDKDGHLPDWLEFIVQQYVNKVKPPPPPPDAVTSTPLPPHWQYKQSTGDMSLAVKTKSSSGKSGEDIIKDVGQGYAGHGQGLNNPQSQSVSESADKTNAGPIPQGTYTIGPAFNNVGSTGLESMRLQPDAGNEMFGRSDFLIHGPHGGDQQDSSEGCPVLPKATRDTISGSGVTSLEVIP
jgi:RHS repeat-associated protein